MSRPREFQMSVITAGFVNSIWPQCDDLKRPTHAGVFGGLRLVGASRVARRGES